MLLMLRNLNSGKLLMLVMVERLASSIGRTRVCRVARERVAIRIREM